MSLVRDQLRARLSELCKDMGLGSKTLDGLCDEVVKGLSDDASAESIAECANKALPFAKLLQSEGTRVSADVRRKLEVQKKSDGSSPMVDKQPSDAGVSSDGTSSVRPSTDGLQGNGISDARLDALSKQLADISSRLQAREQADVLASRRASISESAKRIGLPEALAQQIVIPDGSDIDEVLTTFKQSMVTSALPSLGSDAGVKKDVSPSDEQLKGTIDSVLKEL